MGHPLGILPDLGQQESNIRSKTFGILSKLNDELLVNVLSLLPPKDLARVTAASRGLYCFGNYDELWKGIVLENITNWNFQYSWQETYLRACAPKYIHGSKQLRPVANGLRSDLLYQSWLCSYVEIDPSWLETDNIDRRSGLTVDEFKQKYEVPNRPVVLTDQAANWPAIKKWSREYLRDAFKDKKVLVGDAPISFDAYCDYADGQSDEMPLYLFDKHFCESAPQLADDFFVPPHFSEDLFSVLGTKRPDYRWLIIGPLKSGSTYHVDPNATCAWNAVIKGSKKWVLYPPSIAPPGVQASADGVDVASPVSIMEWFIKFYQVRDAVGCTPVECTVRAGEILFVPRGWWHTALNLEDDTIAVTQNYVSKANLAHVLKFLGTRNPELVSGLESVEERKTLYDRFLKALEEQRPEVLAEHRLEEERKIQQAKADSRLSALFKNGATDSKQGQQPPLFANGSNKNNNTSTDTTNNNGLTEHKGNNKTNNTSFAFKFSV